ncbi:MAG: lasso peptide biosynthesis B2 protein [Candidatus Tectomicrobia bacterium]|nr:lasso peptide biosynthesis B2 protein [Candidatus Tectomicrobia bacterium]
MKDRLQDKVREQPSSDVMYRLNDHVFQVVENETSRLLDFERGRFYGLDCIGTQMFTLLLTAGRREAIARVAKKYDVPKSCVEADLDAIVRKLRTKRVLVSRQQQSKSARLLVGTLFSGVVCLAYRVSFFPIGTIGSWITSQQRCDSRSSTGLSRGMVRLSLIMSWMSLRVLGWTGTISLFKRWHHPQHQNALIDDNFLAIVDRYIREEAAGRFFLSMACKERAVTGYHILRAVYGLPATLTVGTRRYPFEAHAWVQCGDRVLTDDPEHCDMFTPVVTYS